MKELVSTLRRLEAHLQDELAAQTRSRELLEVQRDALLGRDPALVYASNDALERDAKLGAERTRRRTEIVRRLASHWNVAPETLTLGSIAQRAGPEGERIQRLRAELRERTAATLKTARRVGSLARLHERFFADVLQLLLASVGAENPSRGGALLDAEA